MSCPLLPKLAEVPVAFYRENSVSKDDFLAIKFDEKDTNLFYQMNRSDGDQKLSFTMQDRPLTSSTMVKLSSRDFLTLIISSSYTHHFQ